MTCSTYSSRPNRPAASGTSRALCQSVMKTSWSGEHRADGVAQERREMTRHRRDEQDARLRSSRCPSGSAAASRTACGDRPPRAPARPRWPTRTESMPKAGRRWVSCASANTSTAAAALRTGSQSEPRRRRAAVSAGTAAFAAVPAATSGRRASGMPDRSSSSASASLDHANCAPGTADDWHNPCDAPPGGTRRARAAWPRRP